MHESSLSLCRRLLGDERGIALPFALGVTMVLSALAAAIFTYTTTNQGAAKRAQADQKAYGLAETGLSYALVAAPERGRSDQLGQRAVDDGGAHRRLDHLQRRPRRLDVDADLDRDGHEPVRPGLGERHAHGQHAGGRHDDHASRHAPVGLPLRRPAVRLHLDGEQRHDERLAVRARQPLSVEQLADQQSGRSSPREPLRREQRADRQHRRPRSTSSPQPAPCHYTGSPVACGPASHVYAGAIATNPPTITKPTADLAYWYSNAQLGPQSACTTGSFPAAASTTTAR